VQERGEFGAVGFVLDECVGLERGFEPPAGAVGLVADLGEMLRGMPCWLPKLTSRPSIGAVTSSSSAGTPGKSLACAIGRAFTMAVTRSHLPGCSMSNGPKPAE
jgi:hypothetical protein